MNSPLLVAASVFVVLAALVHVYIFVLESLTWTSAGTRKTFGISSEAEAQTIKPMAFNQGFYNLFLAIEAALGVVLLEVSQPVGLTLMIVGAGSMLLASLVLVSTGKRNRRSAFVQGITPLVGLVLVLLAALVGP
jgi:putative membrane protein